MRVFKIYLYKLQTKKRDSFIYFAHTSFSFSEKFSNLNEKFSMMFENDVVSLIWCFAEIRTFKFFTTKSSNIIYQKFFFFFSNFFFTSLFIFIFVDFSSTFIVFFFSFFFFLFICCNVIVLNRKIVSTTHFFVCIFSSALNIFEKNDFFVEIVSSKIEFDDWCRKYIFYQ